MTTARIAQASAGRRCPVDQTFGYRRTVGATIFSASVFSIF
jgi:hypothetical protein